LSAATPRLRILVVEDEPLNRALLRAIFERAADHRLRDAELVEATSLADGRLKVLGSDYDLILLDRRLPDGDGFDLARELRAARPLDGPIILALTADAVPAAKEDAIEAGCTATVTKPCRPAELTALLRDLLDGGSSRAASPSQSATGAAPTA
jgi:CheY-like chemotaxis protein